MQPRNLLVISAALSFCMSSQALAEDPVTAQHYEAAQKWVVPWSATSNPYVKNLLPIPRWLGDSDEFWYRRDLDDGFEFTLVNATNGEKRPAFDHAALASALRDAGVDDAESAALPFQAIVFSADRNSVQFEVDGTSFECSMGDAVRCAGSEPEQLEPGLLVAPNEELAVYTDNGNLFLLDLSSGERKALTSDGEPNNGYGLYYGNWKALHIARVRSGERQVPMETKWSPRSKHVLVTHLDDRHVAAYPFVETAPHDGTHRPKVYLPRIPLTGERPPTLEWHIVNVETGRKARVDLPYDELFHIHQDMTALRKVWWSEDEKTLFALAWGDNIESAYFFRIDTVSGQVTKVIEEFDEPRMQTSSTTYNPPNVDVVNDGAEVIWFSMRDGWGHLYLYDGISGDLKNRITSGNWLVRDIIKVDEERRRIFFTAGGSRGSNPYYRHLYKVNFDGSDLTLLSPDDADHLLTSPYNDVISVDGAVGYEPISPSGDYVAFSFSTPLQPTKSVIRRTSDGSLVSKFEAADATALYEAGWRDPEEFVVKAADGETDLYGLLYKPADFDPSKSYPIVDSQYASPLTAVVPRNFNQVLKPIPGRTPQMSLTELNFVVFAIDARGTTYRSREFTYHSDKNLNVIGLDDHVAAIKTLAETRPWMDTDRVGIHGSSYGGFTTFRAMIEFPEIFKVGFSNVGVGALHNMYPDYHWEAFHGKARYANETRYYDEPTEKPVNYVDNDASEQIDRLQGKLFIAMGELDENVLPATTLQVIDRLIELDKDFDMLMIPNADHRFPGPYLLRKLWDHLVEHLHGQTPPAYKMKD